MYPEDLEAGLVDPVIVRIGEAALQIPDQGFQARVLRKGLRLQLCRVYRHGPGGPIWTSISRPEGSNWEA